MCKNMFFRVDRNIKNGNTQNNVRIGWDDKWPKYKHNLISYFELFLVPCKPLFNAENEVRRLSVLTEVIGDSRVYSAQGGPFGHPNRRLQQFSDDFEKGHWQGPANYDCYRGPPTDTVCGEWIFCIFVFIHWCWVYRLVFHLVDLAFVMYDGIWNFGV